VKRLLKIPAAWGAKISGEQFREVGQSYGRIAAREEAELIDSNALEARPPRQPARTLGRVGSNLPMQLVSDPPST
jgi:hypothetical protein